VRLDHFFYYSARTASAFARFASFGATSLWNEEATVCRVFPTVARFASYGGPAEALAKAGSSLFDIVWDDPDFARFASYVEAGHAACRAEAPEARRRGPQATKSPACDAGAFPVVIGEGSHPFPFRTRKLSSLPPMVLRG
jgi:hypothetical protein